jgi:uncharacterized membrane protein YedE/YeeE
VISTALAAGVLFGYCAQRGGFCLTRALSNWTLMGDAGLLRAYALALLVAVIGVHALQLGITDQIPVRPFRWLANLLGGLIFGVGMILGGGCAGSSWYRLGEGALGAWVVLLGFAMGATAASVGFLAPLRQMLGAWEWEVEAAAPTVPSALGVNPWLAIAGLTVPVGIWLWRGEVEPEHGKWRWPVTGATIGATITAGWFLSLLGGSRTGITFAANTGHLLTYPLVRYPGRVTWSMVLLAGVVAGSALAARGTGQFGWKPVPGFTGIKLFAGGLTMGVGALLADGCNITQGLTNSATLALGSLTAFAAMLAGGWLTLRLLYGRRLE